MSHFRSPVLILGALLALVMPLRPVAPAQAQSECRTFAETGQAVCGRFLAYWQSHGGVAQQGYPLGAAFTAVSVLDGKPYTMQAFERAVLEAHPENPAPNDLLLSQLGTFRYKQKYPTGAPGQQRATSNIHYFPETGHAIGGTFWAYWQSHGGVAQQGYPLTEEFTEVSDLNGKPYVVQYFERAVFERHPENAAPYDVLLTQLGTLWVRGRQAPAAQVQHPAPAPAGPARYKGVNYTGWYAGAYSAPASDQALAALAATGANSLALVVTAYQSNVAATAITYETPQTPTDADLLHVIALAHKLGLKVLLKPHLDLADDPAHWRGQIGAAFADESQWQAWFAAYRAFINHYAALAQQTGVDLFCAGTELVGTSAREADWRATIAGIRGLYGGPITYASNWGGDEARIRWWDAVNFIGVDAYYPLADGPNPSVDDLKRAWVDRGYVGTLESLAQRYQKPVLITEIGYGSITGTTHTPFTQPKEGAPAPQEQANAYEAAFAVLWGKPWLAGIYWWNWAADGSGAADDTSYSPYKKPAEQILRAYYGASR